MVLMLFGCIPHLLPQQAEVATPVDVAMVVDQLDQRAVRAAPETTRLAIQEAMERRNLVPQFIGTADLEGPFASSRNTSQRLRWMFAREGAPAAHLLAEVSAAFYSFIGGRYRWTVSVILTLSDEASPGDEQQERFDLAIYLDHDHEREDAAISEAAPFIAQRAGAMLDTWLVGR